MFSAYTTFSCLLLVEYTIVIKVSYTRGDGIITVLLPVKHWSHYGRINNDDQNFMQI